MSKPLARGRKPLKQTISANEALLRSMALASGKPFESLTPAWHKKPTKRDRAVRNAGGEPLEKEIQRAIMDYLKAHPKVAFVGRFNSGVAANQGNDGKTRYTRFSTVRGFPDIHGMLKGGAAFYFEVKRPSGRATPEQELFIEMVKAFGGIAAVVYSVTDAHNVLEAHA